MNLAVGTSGERVRVLSPLYVYRASTLEQNVSLCRSRLYSVYLFLSRRSFAVDHRLRNIRRFVSFPVESTRLFFLRFALLFFHLIFCQLLVK